MLIVPKTKSLILPPVHNLVATPSATAPGVAVTASASINTKGAWAQAFAAASVPYDVYGIWMIIILDSASATLTRSLYDIGIGGAGSEIVKIPNILNTGPSTLQNCTMGQLFFFPIFIPKGTRIAVRKQSNIGSEAANVTMWLVSGGGLSPWDVFTGCDSYGTDVATSGGLAHTPGNTGTYSTWANIGATLSRDYGAIVPMVGMGSDTTQTALMGYLQLGINSVNFGQYFYAVSNVEAMGYILPPAPLHNRWASGTQMMLRSTMSGTADDNYEFGFLAFY